jgi:hypothetical protein
MRDRSPWPRRAASCATPSRHRAAVPPTAGALVLLLGACCPGIATGRSEAAPPASILDRELQEPAPPAPKRTSPFGETFGARVGGMLVGTYKTEATLDVTGTNVGTKVNFEDELGLAGQGGAFRADAWFRPGQRDRIDVAWFKLDRSATRTIDRDINWGGEVIPVNASVTGDLSTDILQLRYTYYFFENDDFELGAGLGIYGMNVGASLRAEAVGVNESFKTPVPLPVVGLQGAWAFAPRWQVLGAGQFFFMKLDNVGSTDEINGGVIDVLLGVEYEVMDKVGIGTCYDYFKVHAGAIRNRLDFDFDYGYSAVFVYLTVKI